MQEERASLALETSFEDFLVEENELDDADACALKRVLAWKMRDKMEAENVSQTSMAKAMNTSRTQVKRLLDPEFISIQLDTVQKAAKVLGLRISMSVEDA